VINRATDPRTTDRIVYQLVRTQPDRELPTVIGTATFRQGETRIDADEEVQVAVRELLSRPFVDRVRSDERPRGYRRSREGQVDLLVPGMPEHFIARMRGLWLSYPDGTVVSAREAPPAGAVAPLALPEPAETTASVIDPAVRRATLAISDATAGGRPLVRPHPPIEGDRPLGLPPRRTDCGWLT
jgi:hypothetical protein